MIARKYNPGFLTDDEMVASFCVRTAEFELLAEVLRECTGSSNPHQIVIGPRGSGKTSLLLRIAAEVSRDAALSSRFFPVVFAEESYEVATAGEFWLECLSHLADQAPRREDDPDLHRTVDELRAVRGDQVLAERCLGALLDFSDREGKRLVLLVENLNMMFGEMADPDAGWRLRKTLQTEPRIVVLASATSRFDEIDNPEQALFDLFRVRTLRRLDTDECAVLWESVSGRCPASKTIRSLEILTGGSPRLIAIVAGFGAGLSFRELMADLLDLVDDHTEYFKSHLESLPAQERRVYLALADLWKPATTREIAERARLDASKCSAQLTRLTERGAVLVAGGTARRKQYYLTERLYNIYYLLRRHRRPDRLIEALVHFMASYYSPPELKEIGTRISRELKHLDAATQSLHRAALAQLMELPALAGYREESVAMTTASGIRPDDHRADQPHGTTDTSTVRAAKELFEKTAALGVQISAEDALAACNEVVRRFGKSEIPTVLEWVAKALVNRGVALRQLNRLQGALVAWDDVVGRFGGCATPVFLDSVARALVMKGGVLAEMNRPQNALAAFNEVVRRVGDNDTPVLLESVAKALVNKGIALRQLKRLQDALAAWDDVVRRVGDIDTPVLLESVAKALVNKGMALTELNRRKEALAAWNEVERRFGEIETAVLLKPVATALFNKGATLGELNRPDEAIAAYDEVVHRFGASETPTIREMVGRALANKGSTLGKLSRLQEALVVHDELVRRFGESELPADHELVAVALIRKGVTLGELNQPEHALAVCDEMLRRFGESETPAILEAVAKVLVLKGMALGKLNRVQEALAAYDKAVHRFGASETPVLQEPVAMALFNRGVALGELNRPKEALAAYEEIARRFGVRETPILLDYVARALVNKGGALGELNRSEDALAACDEVVRRFGESKMPALLEPVAIALRNKVVKLDELNRPVEALAVYDEIVRRFGTGEMPSLLDFVATAFLDKGVTLGELNRSEEALTAYEEVVHRFGASQAPSLLYQVAKALVNKGITLGGLNRPEEALATYEEVIRRFGESSALVLLRPVAKALGNKGLTLVNLNRTEEAQVVYDEMVRRFGESEDSALRGSTERALLEKADLELEDGRYVEAIETAGRVLDYRGIPSPARRWRGHLIRAKATFAIGEPSACEQDVEAILTILPELGSLPKENLDALVAISAMLGPARMRDLIKASPSAAFLLPLTTALELELGLEPRVAREIEEVAQDIRRDLAKLQEREPLAPSSERKESPRAVKPERKDVKY